MTFCRTFITFLLYSKKLQYAKCEYLTSFKSKNNIYKMTQPSFKSKNNIYKMTQLNTREMKV